MSLEAPDDEGVLRWPKRNRITRKGRRIDPMPTLQYFAEDDEEGQASGGLNHLVQRNVGVAQWTWKKVIVVVDSGAAEKSDAEEHVPRNIHRGIKEIQLLRKVQRDQEESKARTMDSKPCPS